MNSRGRAALLTLLLLVGLVVMCGLWLRAQQRQYALDRRLINALIREDDKQALALVEAGDRSEHPLQDAGSIAACTCESVIPPIAHLEERQPDRVVNCLRTPWNDVDMTAWSQSIHPDAAQLVKAMLRHGANVNARNENRMTPLMWAAQFNRPDTVRVLLEHGADVNAQDSSGTTALYWAVNSDIVHRSIRSVAPVNATPGNLHAAASVRDTLGKLLAHGADPNLADKAGHTPLSLAKDIESPDIVALLKQPGAK